MTASIALLAALTLPLIQMAVAALLPRPPGLRDVLNIFFSLLLACVVGWLAMEVARGVSVRIVLARPIPVDQPNALDMGDVEEHQPGLGPSLVRRDGAVAAAAGARGTAGDAEVVAGLRRIGRRGRCRTRVTQHGQNQGGGQQESERHRERATDVLHEGT